ncbi:lipopolysaccharide biosynthesis protein [Microbacterium lushaniae]|nr:lipopolysaccharide biosynthesis protein [Microbacterium lushaniae]
MSDTATDDSFSSRGARGASLVTAGQLARVLLLLISTVSLSRLLSPGDFGLMAICLSVVALGELVRDSGLGLAVARGVPLSQHQKSNLFWINLGLGASVAMLTFGASWLVAAVFGSNELAAMLQWISVSLLLTGFSTQFRGEMNRRLQFLRLTITDTAPVAVGLVVGILWAVLEPSVWALVAQQLTTALVGAVLAVALSRWRPGLPNRASVSEFLNFGVGLLGAQLLAYGARNADNYMLGAFTGAAALGYYSRAYQLLMAPINQILAPLTRVAVPVLSRASAPQTFNRQILAAQLAAGAPLATAYALAFGTAGPLVTILLGDQWLPAIPIFQALCVGGVFRSLNQASYWAFVSTSRTGSLFRAHLVTQPLIIFAMALGLPWGATGVAWGHSVGYAAAWAITTTWCGRSTLLDSRRTFLQAAVIATCFLVPIGAIGWLSTTWVPNPWLAIITSVLASVTWLLLAYLLIRPARGAMQTTARVLRLATTRRSPGPGRD